jgi:hypothetical protein
MGSAPLNSGDREPIRAKSTGQVRSVETLSVQADSIWEHKPWWCQPWTIVTTGLGAVGGSWLLLHRWWITLPLAAGVLLWWWLFLVLVPAAHARGELDGNN